MYLLLYVCMCAHMHMHKCVHWGIHLRVSSASSYSRTQTRDRRWYMGNSN